MVDKAHPLDELFDEHLVDVKIDSTTFSAFSACLPTYSGYESICKDDLSCHDIKVPEKPSRLHYPVGG